MQILLSTYDSTNSNLLTEALKTEVFDTWQGLLLDRSTPDRFSNFLLVKNSEVTPKLRLSKTDVTEF